MTSDLTSDKSTSKSKLSAEEIELGCDSSVLASIIESMPDPVFIKDRNHKWIFVNQAFCNFMGYSRDLILGMSDYDFFPSSQADIFWEMDNRVFETGLGNENEEYFTNSSGTTHIIRTKKTLFRRSDDNLFLIGIIRDVSEQKLSEIAQRQSEERLRAIFDAAKDAIFMKDEKFRYILVNKATEVLLDLEYKNIIGKTDTEIFGETAGKRARLFDQKVLEGQTVEDESTRPIKGKQVTLHVIKVPLRDSAGRVNGICGIARDITATRRLEASLQQSQKLEALGTLAGGVAHDFNNLLTGINGYLYLAKQKIGEDHPISTKLNSMQHLIDRGTSLTRQLLGFARAGALEASLTDLNSVIKTASKIFERTKREIQVKRSLFKGLWKIVADGAQIEQVLLNLFINAWQAMPQGGTIRIDTRNLVIPEFAEAGEPGYPVPEGSYVVIGVQDSGTGMDEATRKRIFEPFFTTKGVGGGTGLGLASAYGIIRNHDGYVSVESEPGKGTRFEIFLPARDNSDEFHSDTDRRSDLQDENRDKISEPSDLTYAMQNQKKRNQSKKNHSNKKVSRLGNTKNLKAKSDDSASIRELSKPRILLIDDEENVRNVMTEMLENLGYEIDAAADGESGVELFRKAETGRKYDLTILDVILPGMGGEEIFKALISLDPNVRVLLCTGYTQKGLVEKLISFGCLGYIQKPFDINTLNNRIREAMNTRKPENPNIENS
ncbi:MAG: hypothetical protein CVV64_13120 [Candidatus Wallbacteria bacterium HGW-Wallbacteria-1]|jgi:PAS domain S-box-containing protein|uniref:histidine kinase n=1 Tax=Candidatus Wallbacteria bacterium HGW-Wallbacteria-1 TaxID=2013854 RepID=A0A2N1PN25_9BACT|nr:MAG: hypothetical protein CVV64_13120 [Candidatus Wallbacteria bacterium HGW-Wallbacteria-1]